jgi:hypothetical protein
MLLNRTEMLEELHSGIILVNFTKVNGEKRDLKCTLKTELLPQHDSNESKTKAINPDVVNVWDVEANGWRSFRLDSVNHVFNPAP